MQTSIDLPSLDREIKAVRWLMRQPERSVLLKLPLLDHLTELCRQRDEMLAILNSLPGGARK